MILPPEREFAREEADSGVCRTRRLAGGGARGSVSVRSHRIESPVSHIHRYPSLRGRLGSSPCQPPAFFPCIGGKMLVGQRAAEFCGVSRFRWNRLQRRGVDAPYNTFTNTEKTQCSPLQRSQPSSPSLASQRAKGPTLSVAPWAASADTWLTAPWVATAQSALLRVSRPVSPVTTSRPASAAKHTPSRARGTTHVFKAIGASRSGGFFVAIAAGVPAGQDQKRKGQTCSTRS